LDQEVAEGLKGYGMAEADLQGLHQRLQAFATSRMEAAAREAANTALPRMKERFSEVTHRLPGAPSSKFFVVFPCLGGNAAFSRMMLH
jgi:hypothetical protein